MRVFSCGLMDAMLKGIVASVYLCYSKLYQTVIGKLTSKKPSRPQRSSDIKSA